MESNQTKLYYSSGILKKWHLKSFDQFTNDPDALKKVKQYLKNLSKYKEDGIGFYLWGANGTGKSHLLNCAFKEMLSARQRVRIISFSSMIGEFANFHDRAKFKELKNIPFLGIEEIGKEFKSKNDSDLARTTLDELLRYRVQMQKPTWITSNKEPADIAAIYSKDIASMFLECSIDLQVRGEDYRDKIFDKNNEDFD